MDTFEKKTASKRALTITHYTCISVNVLLIMSTTHEGHLGIFD